jgi:hypothetical protein
VCYNLAPFLSLNFKLKFSLLLQHLYPRSNENSYLNYKITFYFYRLLFLILLPTLWILAFNYFQSHFQENTWVDHYHQQYHSNQQHDMMATLQFRLILCKFTQEKNVFESTWVELSVPCLLDKCSNTWDMPQPSRRKSGLK